MKEIDANLKKKIDKILVHDSSLFDYYSSQKTTIVFKQINSNIKYFHRITPYTKEEIIDAQKYIINNKKYNSIFDIFPIIMYISIVLSDNKELIVDDEIFKYYKNYFIISNFYDAFNKYYKYLSELRVLYNIEINYNNIIAKALKIYIDLLKYPDLNKEYEIENLLETLNPEEMFNILKPQNLFYSYSIPNFDEEIKNKFYNVLITYWSEFGVYMIKNNI